jgi:hypothetical protein
MVPNNFRFLMTRKSIIFVSLSVFVIIVLLGIILTVNRQISYTSLVGFESLKNKLVETGKQNDIASNAGYKRAMEELTELESKKMSKEEQLRQIEVIHSYLYQAYDQTNNHELYGIFDELNKFSEANFGENSFKAAIQCLDPVCAENPTPKEINSIIDKIKNSNIPSELKDEYVKTLTSLSYLNEKDAEVKVVSYLSIADSIKLEDEFVKAGNNLELYNELRDYLQSTYPSLYSKYSEHSFVTKSE